MFPDVDVELLDGPRFLFFRLQIGIGPERLPACLWPTTIRAAWAFNR